MANDGDDNKVVLLDKDVSMFAMRPKMALALKGIHYESKIFECLKAWMFKTKDAKGIKEELVENLKVLEGELGEEAYYGGERIRFLDLALLSYYNWLLTFEKDTEFSVEAEIPKLSEWAKRCLQNESVSTSLADPLKIYEFTLQMRERIGVA
nr:probable glutathione S-transferase [Ipomoea batatas]